LHWKSGANFTAAIISACTRSTAGRASRAVALDVQNRDGALKLYYAADNAAELLLFKFVGQP
jgi:hypothetical protein